MTQQDIGECNMMERRGKRAKSYKSGCVRRQEQVKDKKASISPPVSQAGLNDGATGPLGTGLSRSPLLEIESNMVIEHLVAPVAACLIPVNQSDIWSMEAKTNRELSKY